jgi:hypothetical protein
MSNSSLLYEDGDYLLHDDYEAFAKKYVGVDYEDLVNLQLGLEDAEDDDTAIELEIPSLF